MPPYEGPDRRSHSNPGLSGDVGELRGVLQQLITQQIQLWSRLHDEMKDQLDNQRKLFEEVNTKLTAITEWKSEIIGGMRIATLIWKAWAAAVTIAVAWLTYLKMSVKGMP